MLGAKVFKFRGSYSGSGGMFGVSQADKMKAVNQKARFETFVDLQRADSRLESIQLLKKLRVLLIMLVFISDT